jgi:hypothetical protein
MPTTKAKDETTITRQSETARGEMSIRWSDWDVMCSWVHGLPRPLRVFQPLAFLFWGGAFATGIEWNNAGRTSDAFGDYRQTTISLVVLGVMAFVADRHTKKELGRQSRELLAFMGSIEDSMDPPRSEKPWLPKPAPRWYRKVLPASAGRVRSS